MGNVLVIHPLDGSNGDKKGPEQSFVFFGGGGWRQDCAKFWSENMISTYFSMKKMAQIYQISKKKVARSPEFYDKLQQVAKNIEGSCFFFFFFLISYFVFL